MARPANLWSVRLTGVLPNGEYFQTGFWGTSNSGTNFQSDAQAVADTAAATFIAQGAGVRLLCGPNVLYDEVRVYWYSNPGPAQADLIAVAQVDQPGGTSAAGQLPNQLACVASLTTGRPGRSFRGRMYWPTTEGLPVDGQLSQVQIDAVADSTRDWLQAMNQSTSPFDRVVIMSAARGLATPVTGVSVDSRYDVQRRRAEQETELRQSVPAPVLP